MSIQGKQRKCQNLQWKCRVFYCILIVLHWKYEQERSVSPCECRQWFPLSSHTEHSLRVSHSVLSSQLLPSLRVIWYWPAATLVHCTVTQLHYINNKYTLLQYYCFVYWFILGRTVIINPGTDSSWGLFLAQWKHCPRPAKEHWLWVIIWVKMFRHPGAISCPLTAAWPDPAAQICT